ncbi:MAG: putative addiction module antidote protein [Sulfurovum sp.]|nr:putative addiction module antidote protein [Sulfurovum sp.]
MLKDGDTDELLSAIGDIAKAKGMSPIAQDTRLGRESLYKTFNSGVKPRFDTIVKVLNALGIKLQAIA